MIRPRADRHLPGLYFFIRQTIGGYSGNRSERKVILRIITFNVNLLACLFFYDNYIVYIIKIKKFILFSMSPKHINIYLLK